MEYGLIGKSLAHSYSKQIHGLFCNYNYAITPLPTEEEFHKFMQSANFKGINVTIPYKKNVMQYCKYISPQAAQVGAVNTIVNKNGELQAHNTDYNGFEYMLKRADISLADKHVMVLGTGGTCLTAICVAMQNGAKSVSVVSRSAQKSNEFSEFSTSSCPVEFLTYEQAEYKDETQVLINTTPSGMYPNNGNAPINLLKKQGEHFILPNLTAAVDVIYNPARTLLLQCAKQRHLKVASGLSMLVAQAKYASEIFTGVHIDEQKINTVITKMGADMTNIALIGMPGSGKSHIGALLAQSLNRKFCDMDELIVQRVGCSISQLFKTKGEAYFREVESEICAELSRESSLVISTGGGVILNENNVQNLQQNSTIFFIDRELEKLQTGKGRPLSQTAADVEQLYNKRHSLYKRAADVTVKNNETEQNTVNRIMGAIYENTCY